MTDRDEKDALLLLKVLEHVPFDGWSETALMAADPTGAEWRRRVSARADRCDRSFCRLGRSPDGSETGRGRAGGISYPRPDRPDGEGAPGGACAPSRIAVRKEAGYLAMRGPDAAARLVLAHVPDRMWRLAGDTATDFNHYSKRTLLSGVIASTTLCWLGDKFGG